MTTLPADVIERVRSYLLSQSAAKGFAELKAPVEEAREALLAEVAGLSEEQAAFKPDGEGEEGWSVVEALRHVAFEEDNVTRQILDLAAGRGTRGSEIGRLGPEDGSSLESVLRTLRAARAKLFASIDALDGSERLDATASHPWFGDLNCRAWFLFQRVHDGDHARQVQAIKRLPGFPRA